MIATDPAAPLPPPARALSAELTQLQLALADRSVTLREIISVLGGRAYELLLILFALPFLLPVSVPGTSTPLGLAVAAISAQLAVGRLPWLPRRLLDWRLPPGFLAKVLAVTQRVVRCLERVLRPRWLALTGAGWACALHLFVVTAAALLLALPMPIPFTNTLPGWTILLLAAGLLERDGLFVVMGYGAMVATLVLFSLLGVGAGETFSAISHWLAR
ncbi:MAG: exopolysaccharide biosynthesis protein [Opitutus sp.]|nr:exopolysaccharide biosynthesis protein [Opitutus sp.]